MPLDKDLDNNRSVKVDRSTIEAMCECNNHKHSFHFNMVKKSKPITLFGSISKSVFLPKILTNLYLV